MNLLLAVFLAGFAALATLMFFDLFWRPRAGTEFNFAAVSVYVSSSHQRHLRWFALHEKRDPAPIN